MRLFNDAEQAAPVFAEQIASAQQILILTHVNPDGDAIGSALGTYHALRGLGKQATPLILAPIPAYASWLPGIEHTRSYQPGAPLPQADLVMVVDTASMQRLGDVYTEYAAALDKLPFMIVDHHVTNDGRAEYNLIAPSAASTCELLYRLFTAMRVPISAAMATCLLLGLTTDTQSFQTSSTTAESLRIAAELLEHNADHAGVVHSVYYALPASSAALIGHALSGLRSAGAIAWTTVSQAMMELTGAEDEAADEVVRVMQRIAGVQALVLFKERHDGTTKISLRSRPPYDVARLAQEFGGGGHTQASGATLLMTPAEAERAVLPKVQALVKG